MGEKDKRKEGEKTVTRRQGQRQTNRRLAWSKVRPCRAAWDEKGLL